MEHRQAQIIGGQYSVGVEGTGDESGRRPATGISVRIDIEAAQTPIQARAMFDSPEKVNGLIHQLTRMRDEVWGEGSARAAGQGSANIATVPTTGGTGISVGGAIVHIEADAARAGRIASKLRQNLAENGKMPDALMSAIQSVS